MKRLTYMSMALMALATAACDSDADEYYIDGLEASEVISSANDIVLTAANSAQTAVSFLWKNNSKLVLHGSNVAGIADKSMPAYTLEISANESFSPCYSTKVDGGVATFTVLELNTIAINLGAKAGEKKTLYARMITSLGTNSVESKNSDVLTFCVTCYKVDYTVGKMLDAAQTETIGLLYSPDTDGDGEPDNKGVYQAIVGAAAWQNFYLREGDGTTWGNVGADGTEFEVSNDVDMWNFWYPGISGCYLTEVDLNKKEWSATLINSLSLSGDVTGEMTYIRSENRWMCVITTTADGQSFSISGTSKRYDVTTRTDDAAAIDGTVSFGTGAEAGKIEFGGTGAFVVSKAGTYTVSLHMGGLENLTYEIASGAEEVEATAPAQLYILGLNDVWDFNHVLKLTDEDNWIYKGVFGVESCPWGYYFGIEVDNWNDTYKGADGTLDAAGPDNIAISETGVFLWTVDLKNMTYEVTPITSVECVGLNDNWTLGTWPMTATETNPTKYMGNVSIEGPSPWGAQIILNGDWGIYVGGTEGVIAFGESFTDDQSLDPGTYTLTFDFKAGTYSYTTAVSDYPEALYAIGIDGNFAADAWVTLSATSDGVYSGTITVTNASALEFEVYGDTSYGTKYGPSDNSGNLTSGSSAWKFWVDAAGTYTLTINLTDNTYTLTSAGE